MQRLEERKVRIGHGGIAGEGESEGARRDGPGGEGEEGQGGEEESLEAREWGDVEMDGGKERSERRDAGSEGGGDERKVAGSGATGLSRTHSREAAARARRLEIEEDRLKRIQEKEDRDRERQVLVFLLLC